MLLVIELFGILTMFTIVFVLVWGFIILNQIFGQLRYKNYLMEKLIQTISLQNKVVTKKEQAQPEDNIAET
ncbi:hypothetical protein [Candidatus Clostridium radicumherbarum]|uniref:DUF4083 domain-containing protein n=1 Tax=Candidatus Clostridium radicumherbarum TaxID=3381662 RepID=A0ABW8TSI3_9CLOT